MGTSPSSAVSTQDIFKDYQLVGSEVSTKLGDVFLYRHKKSGELCWIKEINIEDSDAEKFFKEYIESGAYKNEMFITKEVYKVDGTEGVFCSSNCSSNGKLVVVMEFVERDLEEEIVLRADQLEKDYFPESEVWYIAEAVLKAEAVILKRGRFHGDLRSSAVFIDEDCKVKFYDPILLDYRSNSYFKVLLGMSKSNISPEYIQSLHMNQKEPKSDPEVSEVYSLGITLLSVASLKQDTSFYDWSTNELVKERISESLAVLKERYSPLLFDLVSSCVKEKPSERINLSDVTKYIEQRNTR